VMIISGRTADNPRHFNDAVDHGFKHIYLEKPGASTVDDLEAMKAVAARNGVSVIVGFNRNYSRYVKLARDVWPVVPPGSRLTIGRNDGLSEDKLDECFERNAEGMLKNMLIHEIVVLVSFFGVRSSSVNMVLTDRHHTARETRHGFTDFRRIRVTLQMDDGLQIDLWGDRCKSEHAEVLVTAPGFEMKTVRPDQELSRLAAEIEEAEPGCPGYFYLQDAEYISLKQRFAEHIARGKTGTPEGCAGLDEAIEGLKLCDIVNDTVVSDLGV